MKFLVWIKKHYRLKRDYVLIVYFSGLWSVVSVAHTQSCCQGCSLLSDAIVINTNRVNTFQHQAPNMIEHLDRLDAQQTRLFSQLSNAKPTHFRQSKQARVTNTHTLACLAVVPASLFTRAYDRQPDMDKQGMELTGQWHALEAIHTPVMFHSLILEICEILMYLQYSGEWCWMDSSFPPAPAWENRGWWVEDGQKSLPVAIPHCYLFGLAPSIHSYLLTSY